MKNMLNVTVENNQFVLSEVVYQPVEKQIGTFKTQRELTELAKAKNYTRANLTPEAKALIKSQLDAERTARKESFEARKSAAAAKKAERIARMEAQLAKLKSKM